MSDYRSVKVNSKFFDRVYEITHESTMRAIENATTKSSNYSYLSNKRGGWNKRGGGAKNGKSLNVEGVININF